MNYPINLNQYINYNYVIYTVSLFLFIEMIIALWYDLYPNQTKELSIVINNSIQKVILGLGINRNNNFNNTFITGQDYEKYLKQSELRELENNKSRIKVEKEKFEKETYNGNWIWNQFQLNKKFNSTSKTITTKILLLEDKSKQKNVFTIGELEKSHV